MLIYLKWLLLSAVISSWSCPASVCVKLAKERDLDTPTSTTKEAVQLLSKAIRPRDLLSVDTLNEEGTISGCRLRGFKH